MRVSGNKTRDKGDQKMPQQTLDQMQQDRGDSFKMKLQLEL